MLTHAFSMSLFLHSEVSVGTVIYATSCLAHSVPLQEQEVVSLTRDTSVVRGARDTADRTDGVVVKHWSKTDKQIVNR